MCSGRGATLPPKKKKNVILSSLLGPAPTETGTIALDPTFGSFTLLEPASHEENRFLW